MASKTYSALRKAGYSPSEARKIAMESNRSLSSPLLPNMSTPSGPAYASPSGQITYFSGSGSSGGGSSANMSVAPNMSTPSGPAYASPSGQITYFSGSGSSGGGSSSNMSVAPSTITQTDIRPTTRESMTSQSKTSRYSLLNPNEVMTRAPTAKEQILSMSIEKPTTFIGKIKTGQDFRDDLFYENLLEQVNKFEYASDEERLEASYNPETTGVVGMSTNEGYTLSFTPNINMAIEKSKEGYSQLPLKEKVKLISGDVSLGLAKFGVGAIGFTGDVLSLGFKNKITSGKDFQSDFFKLDLGGTERALERTPLTGKYIRDINIKEVGTVGKWTEIGAGVALIGYGGLKGTKGFKTLKKDIGMSGAALESLGGFSVLRPVPKLYAVKLPENPEMKALSFVEKKGDIITRNIIGRGEGFNMYSQQKVRGIGEGGFFGKNEVVISQPGMIVGGTKFRPTMLMSKSEGYFGSIGRVGKVFDVKDTKYGQLRTSLGDDYIGGISNSFTRQKYSVLIRSPEKGSLRVSGDIFNSKSFKVGRGAGYSKEIKEGLSEFGFGDRKAIMKVTREPDYFLREPSGRYKFKPTIKGYEIDLNKYYSTSNDAVKILSPSGNIKRTPLSKTFTQQTQQVQLQSIQSSLSNVQVQKPVNLKLRSRNKFRSRIEQPVEVKLDSSLVQSSKVMQKNLLGSSLASNQFSSLGSLNLNLNRYGLKSLLRERQVNINVQSFSPSEAFKEDTTYRSVSILETPNKPKIPQLPSISTTFGGGDYFIPFLPGIPPLDFGGSKRRKRTKRGFTFTPSFGAVIAKDLNLNIQSFGKGFASETGLVERKFKTGIKLKPIL